MRRWRVLAQATALEMLSEPLSLLLFLSALAISTLAPAFHYHQFGEATRMARDAGFSAMFMGGLCFGLFGVTRSFRRELESGTVQMALAHSVSRNDFLLAKFFGASIAYLLFSIALAANSLIIVNGAAIGGAVASRTGEIARIWGPSLALGVATMVLPLIVAAALNRFLRFRFVLTANLLILIMAVLGVAYRFDLPLAARLWPVQLLLAAPTLVFIAAAAALSLRFKAHAVISAIGVVFVVSLPAVANYYLSDALANGGRVGWGYVAIAIAAIIPALLAFLILGSLLFHERDL